MQGVLQQPKFFFVLVSFPVYVESYDLGSYLIDFSLGASKGTINFASFLSPAALLFTQFTAHAWIVIFFILNMTVCPFTLWCLFWQEQSNKQSPLKKISYKSKLTSIASPYIHIYKKTWLAGLESALLIQLKNVIPVPFPNWQLNH